LNEIAFLLGFCVWLGFGSVPLIVEMNRRPLDPVRDVPILGGMLILGPIGLFMWIISLFNIGAE
jgi:hypothetical protein